MGSPIDRTAKTAMDLNLVNGVTSDAPKIKASDNVLYDYVDGLNSAQDAHSQAATLAHPDGSVKTAKIADGAVTTAKLAELAVTRAKIAVGAIGSSQLDPTLLTNFGDIAVQAEFDRRGISVTKYGATGNSISNDTLSIQAALDAVPSGGGIVFFPPNFNFKITDTLTVTKANTTLFIPSGAKITATFYDRNVIHIVGSGCVIHGDGVIESPAVWDPKTSGFYWEYAVVMVEGDKCVIRDITINNVPRVGIGIHEVNGCSVLNTKVYGNMPTLPTQTGHFGITFDPNATYPNGDVIINGNTVTGCHEGVFIGSWNAGTSYGVSIQQNIFRECWDHGVYCGVLAHNNIVSGNLFTDCANPVAVTGIKNIVTNNQIFNNGSTLVTVFGPAISARDAIENIISNNTIKYTPATSTSVIVVQSLGGSEIRGNIVESNTIDTGSNPVLAIRITNGAATPVSLRNSVRGNKIRGKARAGFGLITVSSGNSGSRGLFNEVVGNQITVIDSESGAWGIMTLYESNLEAHHNTVSIEFNAGSATTFRSFRIENTTDSRFKDNLIACLTGYGTNITTTDFDEPSGTNNQFSDNKIRLLSASLTTANTLISISSPKYRNSISLDAMVGTATIASGSNSIVVTNANAKTISRVIVTPSNAEAGKKQIYVTVAAGSFTIFIGDGVNVSSNATYTWEIV